MRALSVVSTRTAEGQRLDGSLAFRLAAATGAVSRLLRRACEKRGVTISQWRAICVLAEETPMTAERMAARTASEVAEAGDVLTALVRLGLADTTPNGFQLTSTGLEACAEMAPLAMACEAALLAGLAPREVRDLTRLLARIEVAAQRLNGES